ncbi:hypothetical protein BaRGS_00012600 [Batillaria attramentaria]|uniref:Secreted protein n=1 Tax=Batillaria attramentaria TaxID=370345 RepID=A0ABD0LA01_9CAEN
MIILRFALIVFPPNKFGLVSRGTRPEETTRTLTQTSRPTLACVHITIKPNRWVVLDVYRSPLSSTLSVYWSPRVWLMSLLCEKTVSTARVCTRGERRKGWRKRMVGF